MNTSKNFQYFLRSMNDECLLTLVGHLQSAFDCLETTVENGDAFVAITATDEGDGLEDILLDAYREANMRGILD